MAQLRNVPLAEVACRITISFLRTFAALVFDPGLSDCAGLTDSIGVPHEQWLEPLCRPMDRGNG